MQNIDLHQYILHIPHSSTNIHDRRFFKNEKVLHNEINLLTDWATEQIFHIPNVTRIVTRFSRVFCDVERLLDDQEPMYTKGMGIYYTHTDDGKVLREENQDHKNWILKKNYHPHHQRLTHAVEKKLNEYQRALIIDCHSFSSLPLQREIQQSFERPGICLGTDDFHTPPWLIQYFSHHFKQHGYTVALNKPYNGTIVPLSLYKKDRRIMSIMIEINKKLYMNENTFQVHDVKVRRLNNIIKRLLYNL
ncbi:MAG: N-formylglutamate amidohydrolase [Candidatus Roizmanbacteria bacterium]|nr:N-formylglutamate amidohydrolase [Candidatus Roizmanbacteria bacterium]